MTEDRFDRNERLFGKEGQTALAADSVIAVMGAGGLGSHVIAQTARCLAWGASQRG